ncbi:MAG: NCS2 family permease [Hyphomicrobiales bacterium]|nr:NCS2 family permease [Hyphomicrobiales bacterium]MCP5372863.1 NCS2 family permease [Hyphomicrobiales bacterium]
MLESLFKLSEHNTNVRTEVVAGLTTFLTMAYIVFVNPSILKDAGMDQGAVFVATCLAAAIGTAIMGLYANYPVALAPGMGLNAYFTYGVVLGMGHTWQVALGAVFLSGLIFVALSVLPVREWIVNSIPKSLKMAISAGIGMFLAIIGLKNAGIVVDHPATLVTLGDLTAAPAMLAGLGFALMAALSARRVPGAIVIAILVVTVIGILTGVSDAGGVFAMPPSIAPTFLQMDLAGALNVGLLTIVFAFLFVDLFDTAGTLVGVAHQAGLLDSRGRLPRLRNALLADSTATLAGAALGTSTTTSYIESTAGINAGGRTGLTAVVVALFFLACLFLSPLAGTIPAYATAPALVFVACLMMRGLAEIDWDDITDVAPAVITAISMPLTFSVATGIGVGFIAYTAVKVLAGRLSEVGVAVPILALAFILKFALL